MKQFILAFALLFGLATTILAQEKGDISIGIGISPEYDGISSALYFNKHLSDRWQLGLMPFTRLFESSTSAYDFKRTYIGLNVNTRYYFLTNRTVLPYAFAYAGYASSFIRREYSTTTEKETTHHYDFCPGIGTQIQFGKSGWSFDFNIGHLWFNQFSGAEKFRGLQYSFGFFKRF